MIKATSVEARNRFRQLLDTVQREPVAITRHGRVVAFMVSPHDMQVLQDARRTRGKAIKEFEVYFAKTKATMTPAAKALTDEDIVKLVHELR